MDNERISFSIPLDDDGFLELKCPFCGGDFKLKNSDLEEEGSFQLFCPRCGLVDEPNAFLLETDVGAHAQQLAENFAAQKLNEMFKELERSTSGNSFVKFKVEKPLSIDEPKTLMATNDFFPFHLSCCEKDVKIPSDAIGAYCPFCGVKQNATN